MLTESVEKISLEDMQKMIDHDIKESKSIYAPSGEPDEKLKPLFLQLSTAERTVELTSRKQLVVDVTIMLDLGPLSEAAPEMLKSMTSVLLHDGHRHLTAYKIKVDQSSYQENPHRLVYGCPKSDRSRIKKLVASWNKEGGYHE